MHFGSVCSGIEAASIAFAPLGCHAPNDGRICAGWARARAELVANPLPPAAMELIAKWDYSPPDEDPPPTA